MINAQAIEGATLDIEPYQDLHNDRQRWNEMRQLIESGQPLFRSVTFRKLPCRPAPSAGWPRPCRPPRASTVQLPYESRLTVSGRKNHRDGISKHSIFQQQLTPQPMAFRPPRTALNFSQSLQVRINGQIGRKSDRECRFR